MTQWPSIVVDTASRQVVWDDTVTDRETVADLVHNLHERLGGSR